MGLKSLSTAPIRTGQDFELLSRKGADGVLAGGQKMS